MNYATNTTTHSVDVGYYMPAGTQTPSVQLARKWREEVLPHYLTPASRQPLVEASTMVPTSLDDEVSSTARGSYHAS